MAKVHTENIHQSISSIAIIESDIPKDPPNSKDKKKWKEKSFKEALDNSKTSRESINPEEDEKIRIIKEKSKRIQRIHDQKMIKKKEEEKIRRNEEARKQKLNSLAGYFDESSEENSVSQ